MTKRDFEFMIGAALLDRQDGILRGAAEIANDYPEYGSALIDAANHAVIEMQSAYNEIIAVLKEGNRDGQQAVKL